MQLRAFIRGATVHITVKVRNPRTRAPMNVQDVTIDSVVCDGVTVPVSPTEFTNVSVGEYSIVIQTAGLGEGVHNVTVRVSNGPNAIALVKDSFVVVVS